MTNLNNIINGENKMKEYTRTPKEELYEMDHMDIVNMDDDELRSFSKEDLMKAVKQFANESFDWECKLSRQECDG